MAEGQPDHSGNSSSSGQQGSGIDPSVWAALIAGGSSMFGSGLGFMGQKLTAGQREDQRWMNDFAWKQSLRQERLGEELLHNRLLWTTNDAMRAGLHPLAALGVNSASGPSVAANFTGSGPSGGPNAMELAGELTHNLGQNVSRAMLAQKSSEERALATAILNKTNSEGNYADALATEARVRTMNMQNPPPMPPMNQSNKYQLVKSPNGQWEWILGPEASQGIMSDPIKMWTESINNFMAPPDSPNWQQGAWNGIRRVFRPGGIPRILHEEYIDYKARNRRK